MPEQDKDLLKQQVEELLLAQGNQFIKELLRENGLTIGTTKKDFLANVIKAIDNDKLTRSLIENWLKEIEGWGNQHIYLFTPPTKKFDEVSENLKDSEYNGLIDQGFGYEFPEELSLSNIEISREHLSLVWQEGKEGWIRVRTKDIPPKKDGLDVFKFDAYRQRLDRSTIRFEWQFEDSYAAILIHRSKDIEHRDAINMVWNTLLELKIIDNQLEPISLSEAVKSASDGDVETKSARFATGQGHVDLVSDLSTGGIDGDKAVRQVRRGINVDDFPRAEGSFVMDQDELDLSRKLPIRVVGSDGQKANAPD